MNAGVYLMTFVGATSSGGGCLYIGNGKIVGADTGGARYHGVYTEHNGSLQAKVKLSMAIDGVLVNGVAVPKGTVLDVSANLSANFANGQPQQIQVAGGPVSAIFEKIGDV
jgi:hypothetical protein